jgi:hypothetical protein
VRSNCKPFDLGADILPAHYIIDKERRLVISTGEGSVTFAEMKAHQDRLRADPDFSPEYRQLIDCRAVTHVEAFNDEVRILAGIKLFSRTSRRAFVAGSSFIYGMARMATTYAELSNPGSEVAVFHDLASAWEWLGLGSVGELAAKEDDQVA